MSDFVGTPKSLFDAGLMHERELVITNIIFTDSRKNWKDLSQHIASQKGPCFQVVITFICHISISQAYVSNVMLYGWLFGV